MTGSGSTSRHRRALIGWALLVMTAAVLAGCGGSGGAAEGDVAAVDGAAVYAANCAVCHGPEGEGSQTGPPLVHVVYEPGHHPDEAFRAAITRGSPAHHWDFGAMPAQPQVADEEIEAVIAHVRDLQREGGIID